MENPDKSHLIIKISRSCCVITAGFGFIALLGWVIDVPLLTTLGPDKILMAPSTALLFLLFSLAIFIRSFTTFNRITYLITIAIISICIMIALTLFISSLLKIYFEAEHLVRITGEINGAPLGDMSPLTAGCFVIAGLSYFLSPYSDRKMPWRSTTSILFAYGIILISTIVIIAYLLGNRLLYSLGIIPPALTTSLAFFTLGLSLLLASSLYGIIQNNLKHDTTSTTSIYPLILIFSFFSIGIIATGYFYFLKYKNDYHIAFEEQLINMTDQKEIEIVQWRKERMGDASIYIKNDNFSERVKNYLEKPHDIVARDYLFTWLSKIWTAYDGYDRIFLLDVNGNELLSAPDSFEPVASHLLRDESECLESGNVTFMDFHQDVPNGPVNLGIMIPIFSRQDSNFPLGILVLRINPEKSLFPLIKRWPTNSKTAEIQLVRRDGNEVVYLNDFRFNKDSALKLKFPLTRLELPAVQAVLGKSGIVEGKNYRGESVIACVKAVPDSPWFIVALMKEAEVLAPIRERIWIMIFLVGILLTGIGISFGFIWRQQRLQIYKERCKTLEAITASESRYRETLDKMMEGCQILGFNWKYLYLNDSAVRHSRQKRKDLLGQSIIDRYPGIEETEMFAALRHCMEERTVKVIENEFSYPDGEKGFFELSIQPVPVGIFILSIDITERKRAEQRERHLNAILTAIRGVNHLITREKDRERLVRESCNILTSTRGIRSSWIMLTDESGRPQTFAGSGLGELFFPLKSILERGSLPQCAKRALEESDIVIIKDVFNECPVCAIAPNYKGNSTFCTQLKKDGNIYGIFSVSVPNAFAEDPQEQALFREIAEDISFALYNIELEDKRERIEKELKDSEMIYRTLFESAAEGILITETMTRRINYANPAMHNILGYTEDELREMTVEDIHTGDVLRFVISEFEAYEREGKSMTQHEIPFLKKDGKIIYANVVTTPKIFINDISYSAAFLTDVTERKKAEDEKKKLQEQLWQSQKMESIGRLSGGIAHDFNNILTVIIGNAEIASMTIRKEDPLKEIIKNIYEAGQNAANLTHQILAFSRKQVFQTEMLNMNEIVSDVHKMLQRLISENIILEILLAPDLGLVETDRGQMVQVILNLAVNARDAMPKGGKLIIETASVELDEEYAKSHYPVIPGRYEMLSISDTGVGIPKEIQPKIFDPFFTTKCVGKGTGLGLSIVYGIVKQSNGYIWAYSEPGEGTTFKIYLPSVDKTGQQTEISLKKSPEILKGSETIMVVEDDSMIINLITNVLNSCGYTVLRASNGYEALSISEDYKDTIHLLCTDVIMPNMGGRELAKFLSEKRPGMKVLYMSGYTDNTIVHHGTLEKGLSFIQKPFTTNGFLKKIRETLEYDLP